MNDDSSLRCFLRAIKLVTITLMLFLMAGDFAGSVLAQDQKDIPAITITVVDDAGQPLPNTPIRKHYLFTAEGDKTPQIDNSPAQTDSEGNVEFQIGGAPRQFMIHVNVDGFVPMYAMWRGEQFARGEVPEQVTIPLRKGTTIGGQVLDESGDPIADVVVEVRCELVEPQKGDARVDGGLANEEEGTETRTDENGNWSIDNAPGAKSRFFVSLKHPDFASDPAVIARRTQPTDSTTLRDQTARFEMQHGVLVSGKVTDADGDPVTSGFVIIGDYPSLARTPSVFEIQRDGTYRLPPQKPGKQRLTIVAEGFAPQTTQVEIESMMEEPNFELQAGFPVTIQIVDENNERIAGAMVSIEGWQNTNTIYNMPSRNPSVRDLGIPFRADDAGVFHWSNAPEEPVRYMVAMMGYDPTAPVELSASDKPHVIKLKRSSSLSGRVVDATTKQPVGDFLVVPLRYTTRGGVEYPVENRMNVTTGRNGTYSIDSGRQIGRAGTKYGFKIEAVNYSPYFVDNDSLASTGTIALEPQAWPSVQVLDPDDKPVADCSIRIFSKTARLTINNYESDDSSGRFLIKTDEDGKALVPPSADPFSLIAIDGAGYAEVILSPDDANKKIQLQNWATLEGEVSDFAGATGDNRIIFNGIRKGHGPVTIVQDSTFANIDDKGKFRFEKLPPILGQLRTLGRNQQREEFNRYSTPVKLEPGKTTFAKVGFGVTVSGKFELVGAEANHEMTHNVFMPIAPPKYGWPEGVAEIGELDWRGGWEAYQELTKGDYRVTPQVYLLSTPTCTAKVDDEGNFAINVAEAGEYDLAIYLYAAVPKNVGMVSGPAGYLVKRFEVSEKDLANGKLQLGKIVVPAFQPPNAGEQVKDIEFTARGVTRSLSSLRTNYVLLDFWRPESEVCRELDDSLQQLAESLGDKPFQLLSLTFQGPDSSSGRTSEQFENWTNGVLAERSYDILQSLGIWSLPRFVLVDPDGKFVVQGDFESAQRKLNEIFGK